MSGLGELKDAAIAGGGFAGSGFLLWRLLLWFTQRVDRRQSQLDAEHAALDLSWKDYRLQLEKRIASVERQNRALLSAFQHVAAALIRHAPDDQALVIAERLMAAAFPTDFTMAAQMAGAAVDNVGERA